jgi:protein-disulfide isomerase
VFREFLTEPVEVALAGFLLARCAGKDKYFSVLDDFFRGQEQMYRSGDAGALINSVGTKAGLTSDRIGACLGDQAAADALHARVERYAKEDDVDSTPTFVINGRKLSGLTHEVGLADLAQVIDPLLGKSARR